MRVLLDTHIALWSMYEPRRLSPLSVEILSDQKNELFVSLASAWEVEIKHGIGKLDVPSEAFVDDCKAMGFNLLPISEKHVTTLSLLEKADNGHKDPFDRMLLAQSVSEGMKFLTEDSKILEYSLPNIIRPAQLRCGRT